MMWKPRFFSIRICAVWLCFLWCQVQCQVPTPYQSLSPGPDNSVNIGGQFLWPSGDNASTFDEGSTMNIQWTTTFPSVHLYYIPQHNISWDASFHLWYQIACECNAWSILGRVLLTNAFTAGFEGTSIDWVVTCKPNCLSPFTLLVMNGNGPGLNAPARGFWSRLFWIKPSSSTSGTPSATSTPKENKISGSSNLDIAIGVGVGAGVGAALLFVGGFFLWRRYHSNAGARHSHPAPFTGSVPGPWRQRDSSHQAQTPLVWSELNKLSSHIIHSEFQELPSPGNDSNN